MKHKELKQIAEKIAKFEIIIQQNEDRATVKKAQEEIVNLSGKVHDLEDMAIIDEMVQEILTRKKI